MADFITKLLLVVRKDTILVVCDKLLKMTYFITIIKRTLEERLAQLFKNNVQKLHGLLESVVLDKEPQFVTELIKKLKKMLEIEMKLFILFHPQIDSQIE